MNALSAIRIHRAHVILVAVLGFVGVRNGLLQYANSHTALKTVKCTEMLRQNAVISVWLSTGQERKGKTERERLVAAWWRLVAFPSIGLQGKDRKGLRTWERIQKVELPSENCSQPS